MKQSAPLLVVCLLLLPGCDWGDSYRSDPLEHSLAILDSSGREVTSIARDQPAWLAYRLRNCGARVLDIEWEDCSQHHAQVQWDGAWRWHSPHADCVSWETARLAPGQMFEWKHEFYRSTQEPQTVPAQCWYYGRMYLGIGNCPRESYAPPMLQFQITE